MEINLNLLPPSKKEEILKKRRLKTVMGFEASLTLLLVVFLGILMSFKIVLDMGLSANLHARAERENTEQYDKIKKYDEQFRQVNLDISRIKTVERSQLYWSRLLDRLSGIIFPGIALDSITTNDYQISISGVSDNRENLVLLKEKLEGEECFSNVDLPLSDLVDKNNVNFQITFNIGPDCLKSEAQKTN